MNRFYIVHVMTFCMCVTGSLEWKMANITCTTGIVKGNVSYKITQVPRQNSKCLTYFPALNCSFIPAGPVNYTSHINGHIFTYTWKARHDAGGAYGILKGFLSEFWVRDFQTSSYPLQDCYFILIIQPDVPKEHNLIYGQFKLNCFYYGDKTIGVHSILSSYPGLGDCEGNKKIPRYVDHDLFIPAQLTSTTLPLLKTQQITEGVSSTSSPTRFHQELFYSFTAAVLLILIVICVLICFLRRRQKRKENSIKRKATKAKAFVDIEATTPKELIEPTINDINTLIS